MKTQYIKPSKELKDIVEHFYIRKCAHIDTCLAQYPALSHELIFNFGDNFDFKLEQSNNFLASDSTYIVGLQTKPSQVKISNNHYTIGVVFKPWGIYKAFAHNTSAFTNRVVNAVEVLDTKYLKFIIDYAKIYTPMEVLSNIESWLIKNNKNKEVSDDFLHALEKYNESNTEKGVIAKVSNEIDLCQKSFIEKFKLIIGITPIQYLHIKQINNALNVLKEKTPISLTEISNELGFYDQAHFIRVFKAYCTITPGQCRKQLLNINYQSKFETLSA